MVNDVVTRGPGSARPGVLAIVAGKEKGKTVKEATVKKAEAAPALSVQHTPGPWTVVKLDGRTSYKIYSPYTTSEAQALANVPLIAAAPELLQTLKDITSGLWIERAAEENWHVALMLNAARAAIARAEGRDA